MPLHILIAGAGIAGLSTAIALGREGHQVDIFEKSAFSSEIGAAFHFGPYGCRILRHWQVDIESMRPCICKRWTHLDSDDMSEAQLRFVCLHIRMWDLLDSSYIDSRAEEARTWS